MAIVKYQDSIADSATGRPIANVSVQVFEYPSGDAATVYDATSAVSAAAIVTDKDGAYSFYAEDGHYNIVYYHGGITKTLVDVLIGGIPGDPGPASSGYTLLSSYGTLAAMVAAVGAGKQTVGMSASATLSANIVIPANIEILPLNGAIINHGAYTISYAGSTGRWPITQIFNGTGVVTLRGSKEVPPEWFGAKGDDATDDSVALQKALNSAALSNVPFRLYSKIYKHGTTLQAGANQRLIIKGDSGNTYNYVNGIASSTLRYTGADYAIRVLNNGVDETRFGTSMRKVTIAGTSAAKGGININNGQDQSYNTYAQLFLNLSDVTITGFTNGIGLYVSNTYTSNYTRVNILACGVGFQGFYAHAAVFTGCDIEYCNVAYNLSACGAVCLYGCDIQRISNSTTMSAILDFNGVSGAYPANSLGYTSPNSLSGIGIRVVQNSTVTWMGGYTELVDNVLLSLGGGASADNFVMTGVSVFFKDGERLLETWYSAFTLKGNSLVFATPSGNYLDVPQTTGHPADVGSGLGWVVQGNQPELPFAKIHPHFLANDNKTYAQSSVLAYDNVLELGRTDLKVYGSINGLYTKVIKGVVILTTANYTYYTNLGGLLYIGGDINGAAVQGCYLLSAYDSTVVTLNPISGVTVTIAHSTGEIKITNTSIGTVTVDLKLIS